MGSRKKQEAGWRYYYTVVLIPARKADAVLAIRMADKLVWEGDQGDGAIQINAPDAFGGPDREGGFSGRIAVGLGGAAQAASSITANGIDRRANSGRRLMGGSPCKVCGRSMPPGGDGE